MNEKLAEEPPLRQFVKKRLDTFMALVVAANICVMVLMTQWAGRNSDVALGLEEEAWPFFSQEFFDGLEYVSEWCLHSFFCMSILFGMMIHDDPQCLSYFPAGYLQTWYEDA